MTYSITLRDLDTDQDATFSADDFNHIHIPIGNFKLTERIDIPTGISFHCAGNGATVRLREPAYPGEDMSNALHDALSELDARKHSHDRPS